MARFDEFFRDEVDMHGKSRKNEAVSIRISGLSNNVHDFQFTVEPNELNLTEQFRENVSISAVLDKSPHQIYLKADIKTVGYFQCDRCLEEFREPVDVGCKICYVYNEKDGGAFPPDELQIISPDTVSLDLTEDIRQLITLSIPLKLLCSEDCKGLCPRCGANQNRVSCRCQNEEVDPRWQGLKNLLHK